MDSKHFDTLTKRFVSRRAGVGLGLAGLLGIAVPTADAKKKKPCPPCKKRKKGKCKATLPNGSACATGTCLGGQCVAPPVVPACGAGGPCRVFLSSSLHTGNLGGLSGADIICQNLATGAGLSGSYKAWLSDATASVSSRFVPSSGPYQLVNGTQIAANFADLTDGTLLAPINVTETGGGFGNASVVYTGTMVNGNAQSQDLCANWTDGAAGRGNIGLANEDDQRWTAIGTNSCFRPGHLYCFQQR